jgi:hypothetical protein
MHLATWPGGNGDLRARALRLDLAGRRGAATTADDGHILPWSGVNQGKVRVNVGRRCQCRPCARDIWTFKKFES